MSAIAESGAEQIPVIDKIVTKLKEQGYDINKSATSSIINGVNVGKTEVGLYENESEQVEIRVLTSENPDANAYFAKIDNLYYKMKLENGKIEIGDPVKEIIKEEIKYEITAASNDESIATVTMGSNKIDITAVADFGETTVDVKVNGETYKTIKVKIKESWETLSKIAKTISNDSDITYQSDHATVTVEGKEYTINVGDSYKTLSDRTVYVAGFNHDPLADKFAYRF